MKTSHEKRTYQQEIGEVITHLRTEKGLTQANLAELAGTSQSAIHRIEKGDSEDIFIQDNYYYLCNTEDTVYQQSLDQYEDEEKFTLEWVSPETVLTVNRTHHHGNKQEHFQFGTMSERECRVIEILMKELEWS